ncbi:MAG: sulfotransferase [Gemmatimonadetes bacterium]|nr:sulfotransferase [Gemmatimonadota bacterium]
MGGAKDLLKQRWLQHRAGPSRGASVTAVREALRHAERLSGGADYNEASAPVFLLAVSWRTGSTLLQRVLMTDPSLFIWGEPWGRMSLFPRLADAVCAIDAEWPREKHLVTNLEADPTKDFVAANLFPPGTDFRAALRDFLVRWFEPAAAERGFTRWGFKEVRLGAAEALVLRWLFPHAKFVVLLRHPYDAYRSCKDWTLYDRWPDRVVNSAASFARHWNRLALSWQEVREDLDPVVLKYEDLVADGFDFRGLESRLGLKLDESAALGSRVGGTKNKQELTREEKRVVAEEAREGMRAYDYPA